MVAQPTVKLRLSLPQGIHPLSGEIDTQHTHISEHITAWPWCVIDGMLSAPPAPCLATVRYRTTATPGYKQFMLMICTRASGQAGKLSADQAADASMLLAVCWLYDSAGSTWPGKDILLQTK